jgi:acetate kinase
MNQYNTLDLHGRERIIWFSIGQYRSCSMKILVVNIGSTSLKYRLYDMREESLLAEGRFERIGDEPAGGCRDFREAIRCLVAETAGQGKCLASLSELNGIGFKAVHAGPLGGVRVVDEQVLAAMEEFSFLAPAHNPPYIAAMRGFQQEAPGVPLVAVFETGFYDSLDEATTTYATPYSWREQYGVRRYGFHGASHRAASEQVGTALGRQGLRHISCHLGGSSSVAAIRDGIPIDTSFGMSPQSGLPQNNRIGDTDVFAVLFMMKKLGLSVDQMAAVLAQRSGLAGISGASGDVRDLLRAAGSGDRRSRLALDVFVRSIRHYIGAFVVELGGLDVLTFSGGIGENSAEIRGAVCQGLSFLGLELDEEWNRTVTRGVISSAKSKAVVMVLPADEERIVARATAAILAEAGTGTSKRVRAQEQP